MYLISIRLRSSPVQRLATSRRKHTWMQLWRSKPSSPRWQQGTEDGKTECGQLVYRWENDPSKYARQSFSCRFLTMLCALLLTIIFALLSFGAVLPRRRGIGHGSSAPLRFTQDGTFQIGIFEDLHYGEAENLQWGPQQDVSQVMGKRVPVANVPFPTHCFINLPIWRSSTYH